MTDHEAEAIRALEDAESHPGFGPLYYAKAQVHATLHAAAQAAELHAELKQVRLDGLNVTVTKAEY